MGSFKAWTLMMTRFLHMITIQNRTLRFTTLCPILFLALLACREIPTSVRVESGPTFSFRGSGRLASFRIYGPQPGHKIATPFDNKSVIWRIQPAEGYFKGASVSHLKLAYGSVPERYAQTVPSSRNAPFLPSGLVYYYFAETTDAPPAEGFFYMQGNTPVETKVPGLCQSGFVGDVIALKCGTNEPYQEPKDLEEMVRQNRIR